MSYSSEADGGAEEALHGLSAVGLCVTSAAAPMSLHEHEVLRRHHAVRRVQCQRPEQLRAERERRGF